MPRCGVTARVQRAFCSEFRVYAAKGGECPEPSRIAHTRQLKLSSFWWKFGRFLRRS